MCTTMMCGYVYLCSSVGVCIILCLEVLSALFVCFFFESSLEFMTLDPVCLAPRFDTTTDETENDR